MKISETIYLVINYKVLGVYLNFFIFPLTFFDSVQKRTIILVHPPSAELHVV